MKKLICLFLASIMLVLAACSSSANTQEQTQPESQTSETTEAATETNTEESDAPIKVAFVKTAVYLFTNQIEERIAEFCESNGYELVTSVTNGASDKAISDVQNFINSGCNYIFVYNLDEGAQATINDMCEEAGVTVTFMGLELDGYTTVGSDNFEAGRMAGEAMANKIAEKWNGEVDLTIICECKSYGSVNTDRVNGFKEGLLEPTGIKEEDIVYLDYDDPLETQTAFATTLNAYPDAERIAVLGVTDANQLIGAWNAAQAAGRAEQLMISGVHVADPATPGLLVEYPDIWIGQADLVGYGFGDAYVEFLEGFINGEDLKGQEKLCKPEWIDKENVADYYEVVS